jgi:hypothetical protein
MGVAWVARGHPWILKGWPEGHPQATGGGCAPPLAAFFFLFFYFYLNLNFFKKKKFIYLFFNKFIFFIKMDMCRHLIGDIWR